MVMVTLYWIPLYPVEELVGMNVTSFIGKAAMVYFA